MQVHFAVICNISIYTKDSILLLNLLLILIIYNAENYFQINNTKNLLWRLLQDIQVGTFSTSPDVKTSKMHLRFFPETKDLTDASFD